MCSELDHSMRTNQSSSTSGLFGAYLGIDLRPGGNKKTEQLSIVLIMKEGFAGAVNLFLVVVTGKFWLAHINPRVA